MSCHENAFRITGSLVRRLHRWSVDCLYRSPVFLLLLAWTISNCWWRCSCHGDVNVMSLLVCKSHPGNKTFDVSWHVDSFLPVSIVILSIGINVIYEKKNIIAAHWPFTRRNCWSRTLSCTWWHHQMETFSALLALCAGNSPVTGEFSSQRPVTRSFDVFFDLRLNNRLSKQSWSGD